MKVIKCNTPKGQYALPLSNVASHRADYYAQENGLDEESEEYKEKFNYIMEDSSNYEGIDWLLNNCDWDEFESKAVKLNDDILVLEGDFFTESDDFEIIEMDEKEMADVLSEEINQKLSDGFINEALLCSPDGAQGKIIKAEGSECGHDCLQITIECEDGSKWLHKIYTEEV
jgi:hypothetical protein